jgi:hypothetical protein
MAQSIALILFPQDWELAALPALRTRYPEVRWVVEGFDLFKFPQNARLMWFDPDAFVRKVIRRYGARNIVAVLSTHEQFGALCASLLAEKLGLAGTPVEALLRAQHKAIARDIHRTTMPAQVPAFQVFTYGKDMAAKVTMPYPFFVKPVKAAYSVLAKRVNTPDELRAHTRFAPFEGHIIKRLTKPFNRIVKQRLNTHIDGDYMMAETLMEGEQINVDGYAFGGRTHILGTVDAVMYPGTSAFMRFQIPSQLPAEDVAEIERIAQAAVEALGFSHGLFNVELFWDRTRKQAKIIEINPRMAAQFADLYEKVHGINLYAILAELSFGRDPHWARGHGVYGAAASFVYRVFDETPKYPPAPEQLAWLQSFAPDAIFTADFKYGASRAREQRWLGSHRYALLNLGGKNYNDLFQCFEQVNQHLNFDAPSNGSKGWLHAIRRAV